MASVLSLALLGLLLATGDVEQARQERLAKAATKAQEAKERQWNKDIAKLCGKRETWPRGFAEAVLEDRDRAIQVAQDRLLAHKASKTKQDKANGSWARIQQKLKISWQRKKQHRLDPLEMPETRSPRNWKVGDICTLEYLEVVGVKDGTTLAVTVGQSRAVGMQRGLNTNPRMTPSIQPIWERENFEGGIISGFPTQADDRKQQAMNGIFQVVQGGKQFELKFLGAYKP